MKTPWEDVETQLLEDVFYAHDPATVRASTNLTKDALVDSLSVVAILDVLADAAPGSDVDSLESLTPNDFRNLASIRELYERL